MMGSSRSIRLLLALVVGGLSAALAAPRLQAQVAARAEADGRAKAAIDTAAARLAGFEVQRAELAPVYAENAPTMQLLDRSISYIRQYLDEMPDPRAAHAIANAQILRAIEARLAKVSVERRLRSEQYSADSPELKALAAIEAALEKRHAEVRALPGGARGGSE